MAVGYSEYTELKEEYYSRILGYQMSVARHVIERQQWARRDYLLIDATAGSGMVEGVVGSPLIALDRLKRFENWRAVLIEENRNTFKDLAHEIDYRYPERDSRLTLENGCYVSYLEQLRPDPKQMGLLYVDENGVPDFGAIRKFAQKMPRMDILVSVAGTAIKRKNGFLGLFSSPEQVMRLDVLTQLKDYTLIREPYGQWQWTFIFATNAQLFDKDYAKINLYPINSPLGLDYFERANHTKNELETNHQLTLPNV